MALPSVVLQFHAVAIVGYKDAVAEELTCRGEGGVWIAEDFPAVMNKAKALDAWSLADGAADRFDFVVACFHEQQIAVIEPWLQFFKSVDVAGKDDGSVFCPDTVGQRLSGWQVLVFEGFDDDGTVIEDESWLCMVGVQREFDGKAAFGFAQGHHRAFPGGEGRHIDVNRPKVLAWADSVESADGPEQISESADVVHVAVGDEDSPDVLQIQSEHVSRVRATFASIEPIQFFIQLQNPGDVMSAGHGFGTGTSA